MAIIIPSLYIDKIRMVIIRVEWDDCIGIELWLSLGLIEMVGEPVAGKVVSFVVGIDNFKVSL